MKRTHCLQVYFVTLMVFIFASYAKAQEGSARLMGRVLDPEGAPVAAATVYLYNQSQNFAAITNTQGYYVFLNLPSGEYSIKALRRGLREFKPLSISMRQGQVYRLDLNYQNDASEGSTTLASKEKTAVKSPSPSKKPVKMMVAIASRKPKAENMPVKDNREEDAEEEVSLEGMNDRDALLQAESEMVEAEEMMLTAAEVEPEIVGGISAVIKKVTYPETAVKLKIEGKVVVKVGLNKSGKVISVTVLKGAHELLNEEAIRVISDDAEFKPALRNGVPVASSLSIPLTFKIGKVVW